MCSRGLSNTEEFNMRWYLILTFLAINHHISARFLELIHNFLRDTHMNNSGGAISAGLLIAHSGGIIKIIEILDTFMNDSGYSVDDFLLYFLNIYFSKFERH